MADLTPADRSRLQPLPLVPLPGRDRIGASLPVPLTSFVGREREVAAIVALLRDPSTRLVTLTGPGGVGKTRLALAAATAAAPDFPEGTAFVGLAALADPSLVLPTIARAFAIGDAGDRSLSARLGVLLGERRILLILDNLEHLIEGAPHLADLLGACTSLTVLATSRTVLRLSGEHLYPVPPLSQGHEVARVESPEGDNSTSSSPHATVSEAVSLFAQRARAADPSFALTTANAPIVEEIVRRLDGLPLAIELAAARTRSLLPRKILNYLDECLHLLTGGPRDLPGRQRTMRDTIAWSYDLLTPEEQACFRRIGVFAGGFTLESAAAVASEEGTAASAFDLVQSLFEQSLLKRQEKEADEHRYLMLETIREYALDRLLASGENEQIRQRHADHFYAVVDAATPVPRWPPTPARVRMNRIEADNIRATLAWLDQIGDTERFLLMATRLWPLWTTLGNAREGPRWLERGLAGDEALPSDLRALALSHAGGLIGSLGEMERSLPVLERAAALTDRIASPTLNNRCDTAILLSLLGAIHGSLGQYDEGESYLNQSLEAFRELGAEANVGNVVRMLGVSAWGRGDLMRARTLCSDAVDLAQKGGSSFFAAKAFDFLGLIDCARGDSMGAASAFSEAFAHGHIAEDSDNSLDRIAGVAVLAVMSAAPEVAARLLGAATIQSVVAGTPFDFPERTTYEQATDAARAVLGEERFAAVWAAGQSLTVEEAIAEAKAFLTNREPDLIPTPPSGPAAVFGLTLRETEVVRLLAAGRSNREIADALFISYGTATTHVRNILAKLNLDSRTAVAAWAIRHGLD